MEKVHIFISGEMVVSIRSKLDKEPAVLKAVEGLIETLNEMDEGNIEKFKEKSPKMAEYFNL